MDLRTEPIVLAMPVIEKVINCETELTLPLDRTQLFNPKDIENVKKIQAGYKAQPLSEFLGTTPPKAAPAIDFVKPITIAEAKKSLEILNVINFVLKLCPTVPSEVALRELFANIGFGQILATK